MLQAQLNTSQGAWSKRRACNHQARPQRVGQPIEVQCSGAAYQWEGHTDCVPQASDPFFAAPAAVAATH